ncbi:hypothetical protein [Prochlorococcus marinus]|uniref:Uncharacterized protein n=1 Tax=Prochlorococcus marinus (strain MIT 9303) TaxID=59922 RepID=A2CCV6_PROM3|nr:hypothetical protein [Prochlorococcus marinus]ABM79316.1 Hypothetical protein P9303_25851 [Prochlorococcus marinus str. MIT 9303]
MNNPLLMYEMITNPFNFFGDFAGAHDGNIDFKEEWKQSDFDLNEGNSIWNKYTNNDLINLLADIQSLGSNEFTPIAGNFGIQKHLTTSTYQITDATDVIDKNSPINSNYSASQVGDQPSRGYRGNPAGIAQEGVWGVLCDDIWSQIIATANSLQTEEDKQKLINTYAFNKEDGKQYNIIIPDLRKGVTFGNKDIITDQYVISNPISFSNLRSNVNARARAFDTVNHSDHFIKQQPEPPETELRDNWKKGFLAGHGHLGLPGVNQDGNLSQGIEWRKVMFRGEGDNIISTRYFYPIGNGFDSAIHQKNNINTGGGSDYVIYDNSQHEVKLGDGDDLAFPSIKAFAPSIGFGQHAQSKLDRSPKYNWDPVRYKDHWNWFDGSVFYESVDLGWPFYDSGTNPNRKGLIKYQNNRLLPQPDQNKLAPTVIENPLTSDPIKSIDNGWSKEKNVWYYSDRAQIHEGVQPRQAIEIGGQKVYGGKGHDTLHGFDPLIYASEEAKEYNYVQKMRDNPWKDGRPLPHVIENKLNFLGDKDIDFNWDPILLSGGEGSDRINLGDLKRINLGNGQIIDNNTAGTLYLVFGDKEKSAECTEIARKSKKWADNMSPDVFSLDASYDFREEIIVEGLNIDNRIAGDDPKSDWTTQAATVQKSVTAAALTAAAYLETAFPVIGAASAIAAVGIDIAKQLQQHDSSASQSEATDFYERDEVKEKIVPLGSWTKAVTIPDFDASDNITINLIPIEDPSVRQSEHKWSNINFSMSYGQDQMHRTTTYGHTVYVQTPTDPQPNPIAYLSGLSNDGQGADYGWKTWDFMSGNQSILDPTKDMAWFGVLSNTENTQNMKFDSYEEAAWNNLTIEKDSPYSDIFLWGSVSLGLAEKDGDKGWLDNYRSGSSSVRLMYDNFKQGWYWDTRFYGEGESKGDVKVIDPKSSCLHYYNKANKAWDKISYQDLLDNPTTKDENGMEYQQIAKRAQFEYWAVDEDHIVGGPDDDWLTGGDGGDYMHAGHGRDTLLGGDGDDVLIGGEGRDLLKGGQGSDVFMYKDASHSGYGIKRDVIGDFRSHQKDKIDLSGIQAGLIFIGSDGFSGQAGQVRFENGLLQVKIDRGWRAEFEIQLLGVDSLDLDDLIL